MKILSKNKRRSKRRWHLCRFCNQSILTGERHIVVKIRGANNLISTHTVHTECMRLMEKIRNMINLDIAKWDYSFIQLLSLKYDDIKKHKPSLAEKLKRLSYVELMYWREPYFRE